MTKGFVIAIDGPVASGKGTLAPKLARQLNGFYLYTGATYRCIALACIEKGLDIHNEEQVASVLPTTEIHFEGERVFLNGVDVTQRIKAEDTANGASVVATQAKVREDLVKRQQEIGKVAIEKGQVVVIEGRDTGFNVFPDAALKIYLTARDEVRARRRLAQYISQGRDVAFEQVLEEVRERDKRDLERTIDPLPSNPEELGYFVIDNSDENEEKKVMEELKRKELL
jgi:cytidylate kinase